MCGVGGHTGKAIDEAPVFVKLPVLKEHDVGCFIFARGNYDKWKGWVKKVKIYFIAVYKFKHESSYSLILKAEKGPLAWH